MAEGQDETRGRIETYPWPPRRGGVEVVRANRGYTLYSRRTGAPVARLRPAGQDDKVQVLWWRREGWGNPGPLAVRSCCSTTPSSSSPPRASSGSTPHDGRVTARAK
ncbi:MAG TPA: hypothetical protein VEY31_06345, partial [Roseococcus sp.]|nr:hypothetical protein [Roseococcus sp.]